MRTELLELVHHLHAAILEDRQQDGRLSHLDLKKNPEPLPASPGAQTMTAQDGDANSTLPTAMTLERVREDMGDCQRCQLGGKRKHLVFGEGNPRADLVFVGEAPGADEDLQGRPFVGRAGQLLTKIIEAMGLMREDVYICNILKCRPPGNRNPEPPEVAVCEPFLIRQLQVIRPRIICALGSVAAKTLLNTETPITLLRGRFQAYQGIMFMPTYHPAYLLRNPGAKKQVWEDMQAIMKELGLPLPDTKKDGGPA